MDCDDLSSVRVTKAVGDALRQFSAVTSWERRRHAERVAGCDLHEYTRQVKGDQCEHEHDKHSHERQQQAPHDRESVAAPGPIPTPVSKGTSRTSSYT